MSADTELKDILVGEGEVADQVRRRILISTWALEYAMASLIKDYQEIGVDVTCQVKIKRPATHPKGKDKEFVVNGKTLK